MVGGAVKMGREGGEYGGWCCEGWQGVAPGAQCLCNHPEPSALSPGPYRVTSLRRNYPPSQDHRRALGIGLL